MSEQIEAKIGAVRRRQILLLSVGVASALLPTFTQMDSLYALVASIGLFVVLAVLLPLSYWLFASAVEKGAARLRGAPIEGMAPTGRLAILTFLPLVGMLIEVVVLYRLAQATARLEGAVDRSGLVLGLACARIGWVWIVGPVLSIVAALTGPTQHLALFALAPVGSFALLGFITQIIITPMLDHLMPTSKDATLGAAGASSSMAVPSSRIDE